MAALENDKKRELEKLAAERENIRLQEQSLFSEVKNLSVQIQDEEELFRKKREELQAQVQSSDVIGQILKNQKSQMLKEHSEKVTGL